MADYLGGAFRDSKTYEFKDYTNVRSVEDYVNYLESFVLDSVYVDQEANYEPLAPIDINTLMRYNRVASGLSIVQRRGSEYKCDGASRCCRLPLHSIMSKAQRRGWFALMSPAA